MGVIELFVLILVVVVLAALTVWAIGKFAPGTPAIVTTQIVWGVAVLVIVVALLRALGIVGYDPQVPRLR